MRFSGSVLLSEILEDQTNFDLNIEGVCDWDSLEKNCALFCFDSKDFQKVIDEPDLFSDLACIFIARKNPYPQSFPIPLIPVSSPRLYFQKILQLSAKKSVIYQPVELISHSVKLSPHAQVGKNVSIGEYTVVDDQVVIEDDVKIGAFCRIHRGSILKKGVILGDHCVIDKNVVVGERTEISHHTMIGADGFGFEREGAFWKKIPHFSGVQIGQDCFIGSFVAIASGILKPTLIGDCVIVDNHVQIAHHVSIGSGTAIAGCVGIAGSARIGKNCLIGGATKISGHISICDQCQITGMTMVTKSLLNPGVYSSGMPVDTNKEWKKKIIALNKFSRNMFLKHQEEIQS